MWLYKPSGTLGKGASLHFGGGQLLISCQLYWKEARYRAICVRSQLSRRAYDAVLTTQGSYPVEKRAKVIRKEGAAWKSYQATLEFVAERSVS